MEAMPANGGGEPASPTGTGNSDIVIRDEGDTPLTGREAVRYTSMLLRVDMAFLNPVDLFLILGIAGLIFGPKQLPKLGEGLGKFVAGFRREVQQPLQDAANEVKGELNPAIRQVTEVHEEIKQIPPRIIGD